MAMNSGIRFNIFFRTKDGLEHSYLFNPETNTPAPQLLTLQAPFEYGAALYFLNLTVNELTYPTPPSGFTDVNLLWKWVQENLPSLGTWHLLENSLLLIVNATSGSMSIATLENLNGLSVLYPTLQDDEFYMVGFDGMVTPEELLYLKGDVLAWVQENWGNYGTWTTDGVYLTFFPNEGDEHTLEMYAGIVGAFSSGFNKGFKI